MCADDGLRIDQLNVEMHISRSGPTVRQLYHTFSQALTCGLVLFYKEPNVWTTAPRHCMEFAFVSLEHAMKTH